MDIIFHGHHAAVSDRLRQRAAAGVRRLTLRMERAVDAVVRFEEDGPTKRVEVILNAPRYKSLVAVAEGRYYGPALGVALAKLQKQIATANRLRRANVRAKSVSA